MTVASRGRSCASRLATPNTINGSETDIHSDPSNSGRGRDRSSLPTGSTGSFQVHAPTVAITSGTV